MTLRVSTGLRNALFVTGSFKTLMDGGFVKIYSGTPPSDADASLGSAVLLCTITVNGDGVTGLSWASSATGGAIQKATQSWSGTNVASGTTTFWRFVKTGDTGALSLTDYRLQGLSATSDAELIMTNIVMTSGAPQNIDYATIALAG